MASAIFLASRLAGGEHFAGLNDAAREGERLAALVGSEIDVAGAEGEAVGIADQGADDNVERQI